MTIKIEDGDAESEHFTTMNLPQQYTSGSASNSVLGGAVTFSAETEVIKLKTENEVMSITMHHLQEELNSKSSTIRQ